MLCAARMKGSRFHPLLSSRWVEIPRWSCVCRTERHRDHVESVRFIDLLPTDVDAAIHEAQRCIVEALDLDGSTLFELSDDGDLLATHSWWRPEVPAPPARVSARESFPWMLARLLAGELVCLSSPDELPDGVDRASLLRFGCKSIVVVPLSVAQRIVGACSFGVTRGERQWPPEIIQRLRLVGEHVRQRARPPAQRRGAPPGARRGEAPERSAARGERVPAP